MFSSGTLVVLLEDIIPWRFDHRVVHINLHIVPLGFRNLGDSRAGIFSDNVVWR
jgi:hypothetical protein